MGVVQGAVGYSAGSFAKPTGGHDLNNNMVLVITLAIQAMVSWALLALPVMAPVVAQSLQVSVAYVGLYVALAYVGAIVASLGAGAAIVRLGAIRVSQLGLLVCAAGLALAGVGHVAGAAAGALLIGLGYGPITPASSHLLALTTPAHRMSLVFSIKQTGVPLGGVFAGLFVPSLMIWLGWQPTMWLVAALCVLFAVLSQFLRVRLDVDRRPGAPVAWGNFLEPLQLVLSHRILAMLAACSFVFSITQMSLVTYLVTFLHASLGWTLVAAGLALSLSQAAGVGGRVFWGFVADKFLGPQRMLTALAALMAIGSAATATLSAQSPAWMLWPILIVFGASAIGWNGVYLAEVARQAPPGKASLATGGTLSFTFLGVVIGPPLFGALSDALQSYRAGYAALVLPAALCSIMLLRSRRWR